MAWRDIRTAPFEVIVGTSGDDVLYSLDGPAILAGGPGNDIYWIEPNDTIIELDGQGADWVFVNGDYVLPPGASVEILGTDDGQSTNPIDLTGNEYNNHIAGNAGPNVLDGGTGSDRLDGHGGNDTLIGGSGNDRITGGAGSDQMFGGAGDDVFIYKAASDSRVNAPDTIQDFSDGDTIHLGLVDANSSLEGDQAFSFIGADDFSNTPGELRAYLGNDGTWIVEGDTNGDGQPDFAINVMSDAPLTGGDFFL